MSEYAFVESTYEDQTFKGIQSDRCSLRNITFTDCVFNQCSFEESSFIACKFQRCSFKNCNLSLIQVEHSVFMGAKFEDCRIIGVNWAKASWGGKSDFHGLLRSVDFYRCVLNYSSFSQLHLPKINIQKCVANDVDFSEAKLEKADLSFSDLTNSQFRHTDLSEADLTGATNYTIQPMANILRKTRFSLPEAMSLLYNLDIEIVDAANE